MKKYKHLNILLVEATFKKFGESVQSRILKQNLTARDGR